MATFVHYEGVQGLNLDLVTHWAYEEKLVAMRKDAEAPKGGDAPRMVLAFAGGESVTVTGAAAKALHTHFCTHSRSLT